MWNLPYILKLPCSLTSVSVLIFFYAANTQSIFLPNLYQTDIKTDDLTIPFP